MGMGRMMGGGSVGKQDYRLVVNPVCSYIGTIFTTLFFPIGLLISIIGITYKVDDYAYFKALPLNIFNLILGIIITLLAFRII